MDHDALARSFVEAHFPSADAAVLAGSTARGERTATSDIDLLVLGPGEMFEAGEDSRAATFAFEGEVFEVFAYTPGAFDRWVEKELGRHRPLLLNMLIEGRPVRTGALLAQLRTRWGPVRDAGPQVDAHELDVRRYLVTDVLDDLRDAADPLERRVLAVLLFERLGELLLLSHGEWIAAGKHLPRRLRAWDRVRAERLAAPLLADDPTGLVIAAETELETLGGRLREGFTR
ncbi:nucleotidyltransferase domain-containing protein [Microbacterium sp.]|uniref:nucleotidyltransferase domain-containing protein n=1 Tax=Microbacterium sp. TaxID=51671 RepID=UPI002810FC9B|nr:nucleotidyltransferase domain-containing protein [Microbacterium sp.]